MAKQLRQISVAQLQLGMYVHTLDRDWMGTPFLFQGFEITTDEELAQLRSLCKHVQIELDAAEVLPLAPELLRAADAGGAKAVDTLALAAADPIALAATVPAVDKIELRTELSQATEVMGTARTVVLSVFDQLRDGGGLEAAAIESVVESMVHSVFRNRDAMGWLARMRRKDDYLYTHSLSTSVWALTFGRHLGLDRQSMKVLGTGEMLLDVGKTRMPAHLLRKSEALTPTEWKLLRLHARYGAQLLRADEALDKRVIEMVESHHERFDGSGYGSGLKGKEIPFLARVAGIVDAYDAMISERAYAKPKTAFQAVRELSSLAGTAFQPELVELFIQAVGVFPTGTLVELNTGEVGVVTAQNRYRRLKPEIMLILDANKQVREDFAQIDLYSCEANADPANPGLWITTGLDQNAYGIDPAEYFL
jgi:HD-GYP domain-containing protein (c-di-GMP phosphodiesterase class II)